MRKLFLAAISILMLVACSSESTDGVIIINQPTKKQLPSTQVFVQGSLIDYSGTRMFSYGSAWPCVNAEEGWEAAKFSIRIDGTIPGYINQDQALYWGGKEGPNLGKVYIDFPYKTYDDRGLDYYQIDTKTGYNTGMFRYVLDPTGIQVEKALKEIPDVWEILEYWSTKDVQNKQELLNVLSQKDKLKVIWYVAKEVGGQHLWHVNGILVDKDKKHDPTKVGDDVEVDVHLQEHKDWNEIKTSVHIRTDAENVHINIPIDYNNIVEQDDFAIRIYNYYFSEYEIKNIISHDENGITINITNIDPELINTLKEKYGDGITVEIHSYCIKQDGVWEQMKETTISTGKPCDLKYQITSAYTDEIVVYPVPAPEE